MKMHLGGW